MLSQRSNPKDKALYQLQVKKDDQTSVLDSDKKLNARMVFLQKRLEQFRIQINDSSLKNKNLRVEIDRLRKERVIYDKIYRDLEYDYK